MRICNTSSKIGQLESPGTLIWIGERETIEFTEAFRFCEQVVPQMALRRNLAEAVSRPAQMVDRIVFAISISGRGMGRV